MRYLIQSIALIGIALLFSACTPKITVKSLIAPQVIDANTKKIAVVPFSNDTIGQTQAIKSKLDSIYINGSKYYTLIDQHNIDTLIHEKKLNNQDSFRIYSGSDEAKTILLGDIDLNRVSSTRYFKKETNYDHCLQYEKKNKQGKCLRYAVDLIPCKKKRYDLQTTLKLISIEDSSVIFTKTYSDHSYHTHCMDDSNILPGKAYENRNLAANIAADFVNDITPSYIYRKISIIEDLDIELNEGQNIKFENAVNSIKNSNIIIAQNILNDLNDQLNQKNSTILYNLALTHEAVGNYLTANSLYILAQHLALNNGVDQTLINQAVYRTNNQISTKQRIRVLFEN